MRAFLSALLLFFHLAKPTSMVKENLLPKVEPVDGRPKIALTFDADMTPGMKKRLVSGEVKSWYNEDVIKILEKENVKATIFMTGMWVEIYKNEAKAIADNPLFEIGNHSYSHPGFAQPCYRLAAVSEANKKGEVEKAQKVIEEVTGVTPKFWRFPGGCSAASDRKLVESLGLKIVDWTIPGVDAFNQNENNIEKKILDRVKPGAIIVLHLNGGPNAPKTDEAIAKVIPVLREKGFQFVKMSEL